MAKSAKPWTEERKAAPVAGTGRDAAMGAVTGGTGSTPQRSVSGPTGTGGSAVAGRTESSAGGAGSFGDPGGGQSVTYVDDNGQRQTGVVQNGGYWDTMRDYYRNMYEDRVAANNQAAENAYAQAAARAEESRRSLAADYKDTNRQLYRDYMDSRRRLPQALAAQGYSGGLSESSRVRLDSGYGESLSRNERARLGKEAEIDAALAQREYEGRSAAEQANAQALQDRYANLANLRTEQMKQQRADDLARAELLAAAGDFSGYAALGYSPEEIAYLERIWRAKNPKLKDAQKNRTGNYRPSAAVPEQSGALAVARYIQQQQDTDAAVDYIARELAAGNLFSDEAEAIWRALKEG